MILDQRPGSDPLDGFRGWDRGQNSYFLDHGHVAYQIKWNQECSNIIATILPADNPLRH